TQHAKPQADAFFGWVYQQRQRTDLVNSDPIAKALQYAHNHQIQLQVYLSDPEVPIDTNHLERALRVIPMGRKNWLFNWTEVGAKQVGIIHSLLTTCRLHNVDPYRYLVDVLQRVSLHPAKEAEELTPRVWKTKFATNPLVSDLERIGQ
ncbi:MAG: IS66 family transposase, partial [Alphaproteobacteria bacterium]|nr:IS66 family transposase [Alphaproteobacteria bacterium]